MPCVLAHHSRPQRNKASGLQEILAAERLNEWGDLDKKHRKPKQRLKRNIKRIKVMDGLPDIESEDDRDDEYQTDTTDHDSTSEANDMSDDDISNGEVSARSSLFTFPLISIWL